MSIGNRIIMSPYPLGRVERIIISGTPKPGQWMGIKGSVAPVGGNPSQAGRFTYEPAGVTAAAGSKGMAADGNTGAYAILLAPGETVESPPIGSKDVAYADGDSAAVYWPTNGDLLNCLFQNAAGTADDVTVGDKMIIDDGTGKVLVSTGTVECEPLEARDALTDPTADVHVLCVFCPL
jgi:hypothetical protein